MPLTPGTKLGQYEVVESIGAGGMGEVYRARDTKLGRDIAIKILPEEFARDKERLDRFEREARLLAQLNHVNIATLHGLEEHDGQKFLVMELVEGETLAERIAKGPIPIDESIPLFIQIAEGLEAAHEKGIIHRDLKPANIKIGTDGKPKVLDFGLAKAFVGDTEAASDSSQSPTLTKGTAIGAIMGTASYMSPEQAKGKTVDRRTDIWAFGCVLFETLTGRKVFAGDDVSEILAAVLRDEPDWNVVPQRFSKLLRRCLERDVRRRFQHIGDVRVELEEVEAAPASPAESRKLVTLALASGLVAALGLAAWGWLRSPVDVSSGVTRSTIELEYPFAFDTQRPAISISRDGARILAIVEVDGWTQVYVRDLSEARGRLISGTEGAREAFFSPDGQSIGFDATDGYLYTQSLYGGAAARWMRVSPVSRGAAWLKPDLIVISPSVNSGLTMYSATERTRLTSPDTENGERSHRWSHALPGTLDEVIFTLASEGSLDEASIAIASLETGETRVVFEGGHDARITPSGHLVFARGGALMATSIDSRFLEAGTVPVTVVENLSSRSNGGVNYDLSENGTLVYIEGDSFVTTGSVVRIDPESGVEQLVERRDAGTIWDVAISPDGQTLAMTYPTIGNSDIWTYDLTRDTSTRMTLDPGEDYNPIWSPDGEWLAFSSEMQGTSPAVHRMRTDGTGTPEHLFYPDNPIIPTTWSPDGTSIGAMSDTDLWLIPLEDGTKPTLLTETDYREHGARFSPDGKWLAFHSYESGRAEVYVQPFPVSGAKTLVSSDGGVWPIWAHDGETLFYRNGGHVIQVEVGYDDGIRLSRPRVVLTGKYSYGIGHSNYDVTNDGHLIMLRTHVPPPTSRVQLVTNWFEELERLVPTDN